MAGEWVDLRRWKRRDHYELFRKYEQPFFSVTVEVDVTALWNRCRRGGPSFFLSSLFLMLQSAEHVEAFRLRLRGRRVWRHDRLAAGPTISRDDGTFGFARLEAATDLAAFASAAAPTIARVKSRRDLVLQRGDDIVFHSVLPWLRFRGFTNAMPHAGDSIPRVVFGRCSAEGRRVLMPVGVEVHHAVVDGADVARFVERFEQLCLARQRQQ